MENASKALLIAASVLIAIVLIAFGVSVLNSTKGTGDNVKQTMTATEIAAFNSRFSAYAGTTRTAAQAKALANVVIAHNATEADANKEVTLNINGTESKDSGVITTKVADLSGRVKIEMKDTKNDGLIDYITITTI